MVRRIMSAAGEMRIELRSQHVEQDRDKWFRWTAGIARKRSSS